MANSTNTIHLNPLHGRQQKDADFLSPDASMVVLTWITFFGLLAVLYKFAWKPIFAALEIRENSIKKSLDDVERIKTEMEQINQKREQLITEAQTQAKEIVKDARNAATEAAQHIQHKAREETQILLKNAEHDIRDEVEKARATLRRESAELSIALAGKLIEKNLDTEHNRKIVNEFIEKI